MVKCLKIKIYGRVQGVSFRYFAKQKADELGLCGWARNENDGAVYIEAEGEEEKLKQFLDYCRQGPRWARIEKVDYEYGEKLKKYKNFGYEF
ncbi:acylphosphatase [Candidatus Falkowbacteria bacterium CG_4_9_14_3_um_filter_36_9]|uniref:Acylphosphatase n=2 Tax=Candidatus Falkowiibacteriota TaxID=1752728 RepID=A0A1J4TB43_9BACT|nr:MAG: hypothetical protein AUJ27_01390 [Candidatus Falkowbacteria bacterium CG1_02_37_44]PIV51354.1 MAG: acylphosphatase [Candidatus Falkowbacteria bacterium CG02_land_8_20_14_3_00_36_14]PIX12452.1 MAG: acylphosphatase [Candidatus Falkowbacteria bacterium CG_4_8_14_3_um_filter_36_11]PJA11131.1 MAG: acylphosphatase [Candidatus Falkowbacteria bacterium CG_4_10_14_0_2_um_filter_36_22]PJB19060.1 MAG: acylphosphatase [Candidatus Falkowbacteria bacterium CG_4_9_14_3_um_filter_36_9]